jgi:two-component system chemotaxis response regulator CheB
VTADARRVRVVVAEDSITARHLLVAVLRDDPAIEVVGEAANGVEAIELVRRLRPSVVVMDIRMPVMDGFEATKRIMIEAPTPVVIVTAAADPEVELSLRAVQLGALALLAKPAAPSAPEFPAQAARLVSLVKAFADVKVVRRRRAFDHDAALVGDAAALGAATVEIVAIAASTGGPAALYRLLERLPRTSGTPFLVVQHISEGFTAGLVSWLSSGTPLPVKIAEHGERLAPGTIYVAPEQRHLEVTRRRTVALADQPPVGGFRPSATVLFRSVAAVYGPAAAVVVLTGMGRDGFDGVVAVREAGGRVLAQDEATSVVFGMPGAIVAQGLADLVGPVEVLAERLRAVVSRRIS